MLTSRRCGVARSGCTSVVTWRELRRPLSSLSMMARRRRGTCIDTCRCALPHNLLRENLHQLFIVMIVLTCSLTVVAAQHDNPTRAVPPQVLHPHRQGGHQRRVLWLALPQSVRSCERTSHHNQRHDSSRLRSWLGLCSHKNLRP